MRCIRACSCAVGRPASPHTAVTGISAQPRNCYTRLCNSPSAPTILPRLEVPNFGHDLAKLGQIPAKISPMLAQIWSASVELGRTRPTFGRRRPNLAQIRPKFGQMWRPTIGQKRSKLSDIGQICRTSDKNRPNAARVWSTSAWSSWTQTLPKSDQYFRISPKRGPNSAEVDSTLR